MEDVNSKVVVSNIVWRFFERFGAQIVSFVVSIVLARLLDPVVYGTIALIIVFTSILQVFVDAGFGTALIQKKDSDELDFNTVFYFNLFSCSILYLLMFFFAPLIAKFYNNQQLVVLIRVLSLILVISGFKSIQTVYVSKHLQFKKFFFATLVGTVISAAVGIYLAYKGAGVWALIAQNLINQTVDTILLWITVRWKPKPMFSFKRLRQLFSYGWKLLVSGLLDVGYNQIRALIIGKKYTSEDLAYYNRGEQLPNLVVGNLNSSIDSVLLPSMSIAQNDKNRVKSMLKRSITTSCFILMPAMIGIAACADSIIKVLLTDKWIPCIPYLQLFCIIYAFYPIHTANLNAMKAMGKSNYFLILEIIKKAIGIGLLLATMWISVKAIVLSLLVANFISLLLNAYPNKKILGYSVFEQIKDILPTLIISAIMGGVVYYIYILNGAGLSTLVKQILYGVFLYFTLAAIFKFKALNYIMTFFKNISNKRRGGNQHSAGSPKK